jgi:hypothetical protein
MAQWWQPTVAGYPQGPGVDTGVDRKHVLQQVRAHPVRHQSGQVCPESVQFWCRAAMRWPIDACLDAAARGTLKPGQPHPHLTEERRDRVVTIILYPGNPVAAGANLPPGRVLSRLRGGDLSLHHGKQLFRFSEGHSQVADITEVTAPADFHDLNARTLSPGFHQPHSPTHASPPGPRRGRHYATRAETPSFAPVSRVAR